MTRRPYEKPRVVELEPDAGAARLGRETGLTGWEPSRFTRCSRGCGREVSPARLGWAFPTCFVCLPPPPALPILYPDGERLPGEGFTRAGFHVEWTRCEPWSGPFFCPRLGMVITQAGSSYRS